MKKKINPEKIKWFFIWVAIFFCLIWISRIILQELQGQFEFLNNQISYFLLIGFMLALFSRLISSAIWKKSFNFDSKIIYWTLIFTGSLWLVEFIVGILSANISLSLFQNEIFILFLLALVIELIALFLKRVDFGGRNRNRFRIPEIPGWLWVLVIIIGIILLIQVYVPYGEPRLLSDFNLECRNDKIVIKNDILGLGKWATDIEASLTCIDYKSSRCKYVCFEDKPACQCETALVHRLFTRQGEWIFGGW